MAPTALGWCLERSWCADGVLPLLSELCAVSAAMLALSGAFAASGAARGARLGGGEARKPPLAGRGATTRLARQFLISQLVAVATAAGNVLVAYMLRGSAAQRAAVPGVPCAALQLLAMHVAGDFFLYWGHRCQHEGLGVLVGLPPAKSPWLWVSVHALHHTVRAPTPFATLYLHPLDTLLQGGIPYLCAYALVRPHALVFAAAVALRTSENVLHHSALPAADWLSPAFYVESLFVAAEQVLRGGSVKGGSAGVAFHESHHRFCNHGGRASNYGEAFKFWDWMFGTLGATVAR